MRTLMFIVTLSTTARVWKQLVSINRRMDKEDVVYIYIMKYYSAIKKMKILPFATTQMDLEGIMQSEISRSEKDTYCMISPKCGL